MRPRNKRFFGIVCISCFLRAGHTMICVWRGRRVFRSRVISPGTGELPPHKLAGRLPLLPFAGQGLRVRLFGGEQQRPGRMEPSNSLELYRRRALCHSWSEGTRAVYGIMRLCRKQVWRT